MRNKCRVGHDFIHQELMKSGHSILDGNQTTERKILYLASTYLNK